MLKFDYLNHVSGKMLQMKLRRQAEPFMLAESLRSVLKRVVNSLKLILDESSRDDQCFRVIMFVTRIGIGQSFKNSPQHPHP